jgi:ActR/RegA family two-component response regulator
MKRRPNRKRADDARDLALAIFGATNADDVRMQRVIDRHIARVLDAADGNLSLAADLLGMHRRSLQRYERRKRPARRRSKMR